VGESGQQQQQPGPAPKRLLPRAQRRAQIIDAARRSFARNGFAATSMEDLAAGSGVTKMIIYRHFAAKADLYRAVLDDVSGRLDSSVLKAGRWPANIEALVTFADTDPDGFVLLYEHAAREPEFREHADAARATGLAMAQEQLREFLPDPGRREWAAQLLPRVVIQTILAWLAAGRPGTIAATSATLRTLTGEVARAIAAHDTIPDPTR
jgi:AcrR family transcriptional regulator